MAAPAADSDGRDMRGVGQSALLPGVPLSSLSARERRALLQASGEPKALRRRRYDTSSSDDDELWAVESKKAAATVSTKSQGRGDAEERARRQLEAELAQLKREVGQGRGSRRSVVAFHVEQENQAPPAADERGSAPLKVSATTGMTLSQFRGDSRGAASLAQRVVVGCSDSSPTPARSPSTPGLPTPCLPSRVPSATPAPATPASPSDPAGRCSACGLSSASSRGCRGESPPPPPHATTLAATLTVTPDITPGASPAARPIGAALAKAAASAGAAVATAASSEAAGARTAEAQPPPSGAQLSGRAVPQPAAALPTAARPAAATPPRRSSTEVRAHDLREAHAQRARERRVEASVLLTALSEADEAAGVAHVAGPNVEHQP